MIPLFYSTSCSSTNDEIGNYFTESFFYAALYTHHQYAGKGQYGNVWENNPNENLAYSFAIKCSRIHLSDVFVNYYTAIIVRDFIANLTQAEVFIKWPNDIIIGRKKVSGILIERKKILADQYFIIGIGINILQDNFTKLPKAGSLLSETGVFCDLNTFTQSFHQYFSEKITSLVSEDFLIEEYNNHLFLKNKISVFQKNNIRQNGIISKADKNGQLSIDLENDGMQNFSFKEIELLY